MATPDTSPAALLELARKHLSLGPNVQVPQAYLEELKAFVSQYPNDTNYTLTLQPGRGYGVIICREKACDDLPVVLTASSVTPDGGKARGFGSLYAYRLHVNQHPTHKTPRDGRLRASGAGVKRQAAVFNIHDDNAPGATPRAAVKSEPIDVDVPRKRTSDSAFGVKPEASPSTKKVKQENTNPFIFAPMADSVEVLRGKINDAQKTISHKQTLLDRLLRKKTKTKADLTRIANLQTEIRQLRSEKAQYDASLPRANAASPVKRTGSLVKTESMPVVPPYYNPAKVKAEPLAGGSMPPFPKMEDVKPAISRAAVASGSKFPGAFGGGYDSDGDMDVDPSSIVNQFSNAIPNIAPVGGDDHHDENGDYHGRGRDTFQGPQAKADDIDKFLIEAGNAELFDGNSKIEDALERLGLATTHDLIPGLDIALMPHQLLGVSWMIANESKKSVMGGMLADEMGLGKTVQMIATMVKNPSKDPKCKTTLILCPLALLVQWQTEIATKVNAELKVIIYHGSNKPKRKSDLLAYDVVLTTYGTMALEWPDVEAEMKKKEKAKRKKPADEFIVSDSDDDSDDAPKNKKKKKKDRGLLFQVDFYRIVLDEAQNIRNKRTRVSRAVTDLSSQIRWCLTATPIVNGLLDVYGSLRFLKIRPWYDWSEFNGHIARHEKKQPQLAVTRLQTVFNLFLLRRMKNSMLDGKRLIELPEKTVELVSLEFSPEEREIYAQVETAQQAKFNRFLREGTVLKNYTSVLVLLLRLRQLCSHPALIQENGSHFLAPDEDDEPFEFRDVLARARKEVSSEFVKKMKDKYKDLALRRIAAEKESADAVLEVDDCAICFDALTEAVVTPCGHEFCNDCLVNVLETAQVEDNGGLKPNERACPACRSPICAEKLFPVAAFEPTDKDLNEDSDESDIEILDVAPKTSKGKGKRPARKAASRKIVVDSSDAEEDEDDDDDDMSDFIVHSDEDEEEKDTRRALKSRLNTKKTRPMVILDSDEEEEPQEKEVIFGKRPKVTKAELKLMPRFLPSTKMRSMMEYLKKLALEKPDEKTLVISQWTKCLDIVSDYLTEAGILHVKYQGDMTNTKREAAVTAFMSKDKARVMLMSLKCGGVGLNLTRANHVVSLDLGWSPAIDHQAFDRVHRLGQTRAVTVRRLVIENTVEDRILSLQERKQNLADGSLGEGKGKKIGRLSVKELASLFGLDARGRVLPKA
ncbi:SNF2 family N-terminal domain-containing protein [Mycena amicta]|nr:SNF2 family N-terminal domain-containing protein [Mycena amicta]